MKQSFIAIVAGLSLLGGAALAAENPMVGGAAMYDSKTIVENAAASADHTTLVAAVQAAGLVETLSGSGPFTVFAPVNAAFDKLPPGTVETLLKPENKATLGEVLACHVVEGAVMSEALVKMVADQGGSYAVPTLGGCTLTAKVSDGKVMLGDENGTLATVSLADVRQSNGVIHVIDAVLTPKM